MLVNLLLLAAVCAADPTSETPNRKPSAIAPSLPYLSREEEDKLDELIDRFILADSGRLRGPEARQAVREFEALKAEAIPALIRGLNKAAQVEHSCPVLMIGKKLSGLLLSSDDPQLLEYARDEIGAGIGRSRHLGTLQDLRFRVLMRKNALARRPTLPPRGPASVSTSPSPRGLASLSTAELAKAASTERGPRLGAVLVELETRKGKEVLAGLSVAASSYDRDTSKLGRELLDRHLGAQKQEVVLEKLKDENPEIRAAAARVASNKFPTLAEYLVDLLTDDKPEVRAEARKGLVRLARGNQDFGPQVDDSAEQQQEAQRKWRAWLDRQKGR